MVTMRIVRNKRSLLSSPCGLLGKKELVVVTMRIVRNKRSLLWSPCGLLGKKELVLVTMRIVRKEGASCGHHSDR